MMTGASSLRRRPGARVLPEPPFPTWVHPFDTVGSSAEVGPWHSEENHFAVFVLWCFCGSSVVGSSWRLNGERDAWGRHGA